MSDQVMHSYSGPDRRQYPDLESRIDDLSYKIDRLARLLEGENGGNKPINRGVLGAISDLTHTDAKLDKRISSLERSWSQFRWVLLGFAAGGGLLGGIGIDLVQRAVGG